MGSDAEFDESAFLAKLEVALTEAVKKRTQSIPEIAHGEKNATIQVLFSGGLDSTLLVAILSKILNPNIALDLVNVSFDPATSADRISSLFAYSELKALHPTRKFRLLCADFDIKDVLQDYETLLQSLIFPKDSHMDFNIACALFLGAKAKDTFQLDDEKWLNSETFKSGKAQIEGLIQEKLALDLEELKT